MNLVSVDFLRSASLPRLGWAVLFIGVTTLVTSLWLQQRWTAERDETKRLRDQLMAERQVKPKPMPSAVTLTAERRWEQAQAELRRPWLPTLRAIEVATAPPVYLLSFVVDPASGLIKLEAEAPSFDHALAFVQVLDEGGALAPAILTSHGPAPPPSEPPIIRFGVSTRWSAP